jgi:arabinan endo-1,5-alpha-L-arabinosidase
METQGDFIGPGHVDILADGGKGWLSVHFYDGTQHGTPTLAIREVRWPALGEPPGKRWSARGGTIALPSIRD